MKLERKLVAVVVSNLLLYFLIACFVFTGIHKTYYNIFIGLILITALISIVEVVFLVFVSRKKNVELLKKLKNYAGIDSKISISKDSIYFNYDGVRFQCRYLPEENCDRYILRAFLPKPLNFGIVGVPKFATAFPKFSHLNYIGEVVSADRPLEMEFITLDKDLASQVLKDKKILQIIEEILSECKPRREVVSLNDRAVEVYINNLTNVGKQRLSRVAELAKELSKYSNLKGQRKFQLTLVAEASIILLTVFLVLLFVLKLVKE